MLRSCLQFLLLFLIVNESSILKLRGEEAFPSELEEVNYLLDVNRRAITSTSECAPQCDGYFVDTKLTQHVENCITTMCITIRSTLNATKISHWDLIGVNFERPNFFSSDSGWELNDFSSIRLKPIQGVLINQPYCFNLTGYFITTSSNIMLNVNGYSCQKEALVPRFRTSCGIDCVVDSNFANAKCESCRATCGTPQAPSAVGVQTCSMNILTTPNSFGKPCSTINSRACSVPCPVDCKYEGPFWQGCPANCENPTATVTGFFSTITPSINGGKPCNTPTSAVSLCSLVGEEFVRSCQRNCVVTGIPSVNCLNACTRGASSKILEYSYPITVVSPRLNGAPCPTLTTTCQCSSCIIDVTPTSIGTCDATCTAMNGRAATGLRLYHFSELKTGLNVDSCITTSYSTCYKACPCVYTTSSALNSCVFTTSTTTTTPWIAQGYLKVSAVGSLPECNTIIQTSCSSILTPQDCLLHVACPPCSCCPTTNTPYWNTNTFSCMVETLREPMYGGSPCPTTSKTVACSMKCPGCVYDGALCSCNYQSTQVTTNSLTWMSGTKTCVYPPRDIVEVKCPSLTSHFSQFTCTTLINASDCLFATPMCEPLCTPTSTGTQNIPYTIHGYRLCSLTDSRAFTQQPVNCLGVTSTTSIACSNVVKPVDCTTQDICKSVLPSCLPSQNVATTTAVCEAFTLTTESFGGLKCTLSPSKTMTYTKTCTPSPKPTNCIGEAFEYNIVIYGNATAVHAYACGRVAVQGHAAFLDYTIGECISILETCKQAIPNALVVGRDLSYLGKVMNGNVYVEGTCNKEIQSNCDVFCYKSNFTWIDACGVKPIDYATSYFLLQKRSNQWKDLIATAKYTVNNKQIEIEWSQSKLEVLNMTLDPKVLPWNKFSSSLAMDATIIINIQNEGTIEFSKFSLEYFKPYANRIVWNFYRASRVVIDSMTIYGLIAVPYGAITGNGMIYGSAYALSMDIYNFNTSLTFRWEAYVGYCF